MSMTLYTFLICIQYVSIALMIFMCAYIARKWSKPIHGWFFFYSIVTLINNAGYLALMLARTEGEAVLLWQFIYLGRAWIPFTLFMFVLILCCKKQYHRITTILSLIHGVTYLAVLTMRHNKLYYTSFGFEDSGVFPHIVHTDGVWHYLYDVLCLSYVVIGMRLLIISIIQEKLPGKRKKLVFITLAVFMVCFFHVSQFFDVIPGYDMNVLGYTMATVFFYIAIFVFNGLDTKKIAEAVVVQAPELEEIKPKIEAFGEYDYCIKLPLAEILYFEADAEQVFAYTSEEIYNVKLRLYQIEEFSQQAGIIRVSKSHLVNVNKIQSVRPALNSRLYVRMPNGEEVLVSRKYAHVLKEMIA